MLGCLNMKTKVQIHHQQKIWFKSLLIISLLLLMLGVFILDLMLGSVDIPWYEVLNISLGGETSNPTWLVIIQKIRIPQALTAILAGSALAIGGLHMQTLFRNPLAGPSILGITAGASLGVAVVMLASGTGLGIFTVHQIGNWRSWLIVFAAIIGSACILFLVLALAIRIRDNIIILIVGIMMGNLMIAIVSIWQYFSEPEQIQDYLIWTFGSLGGTTQSHLLVLSICIGLGILMSFLLTKPLNMLLLGENYARSMGLAIPFSRVAIISVTSLLTGSVTAFCGPIGFIGIAVPHLTRSLLNTSDHRLLIPAACLVGAILMLFCDIISKVPGSQTTLPINAVTAIIGAPVVIAVIIKNKNLRASF